MTSLSLNTQYSIEQHEPSSQQVYIALAISIAMHFAIVLVLPWLEVIETKPPMTMMAELQQPPPPPPSAEAPTETQPIAPPTKQSVVRPESKPVTDRPKPQSQVVTTPVLTAAHTEPVANYYHVPEVQQVATPSDAKASVESAAVTSSISSSAKNSASASSSTSTWDDSNLWDEYGRNLQRLCERYKQYPAIAIRRNWQGLAKVLVYFSAEGKTLNVVIEKSTGQKVLDEQAIEMVKKSLNDLPVPNKFKGKEFRLSIPIDFKLE